MRVFLGFKDVAGYYPALRQGFKDLGVPCTFINMFPQSAGPEGDDANRFSRFVLRSASQPGRYGKKLHRLARWLFLAWALLRHDVFIFSYPASFLDNHRDLPILKFFGKKVIYQFHDGDGCPPYLDGNLLHTQNPSVEDCIRLAHRQKQSFRAVDRYADAIVTNPVEAHFHTRPIVIGLRVRLVRQPVHYSRPIPFKGISREGIRILHRPSPSPGKGTSEIRNAIHRLQAKGLKIKLIELTNQPNVVILNELEKCDFVVDQVYADHGMSSFAAEAAWFGKPAVIAGYAKNFWNRLLPEEWRPPTHYCQPDDLEASIEKLAMDPEYRHALGCKAREFVETQWNPRQVAERYLRLAKGKIPEDWLYTPQDLEYWEGCHLRAAEAERWIRAVHSTGGEAAFQVSDKPRLLAILNQIAARANFSFHGHVDPPCPAAARDAIPGLPPKVLRS